MRALYRAVGPVAAVAALAVGGLAGGASLLDVMAPAGAVGTCAGGTIVVSSAADAGAGTLRQAFADASTANGGTICIDATSVTTPIAITSGVLDYSGTGALTIQGNGAIVQGNGTSALIRASVTGQTLEVDELTVTGGNASSGTAVRNGNGPVKVVASTITGNTASSFGAGVSGTDVTVIASTIANNTVTDGDGAGINAGSATVINSTITGNRAATTGGGIEVFDGVTLVYSTVVGNSAPSAANVLVNSSAGVLTSFGSVVTGASGGGSNCGVPSTTSNGYDYSDDSSCGFTNTATGDVQDGAAPQLGALAANGGPTETMLPATSSPLIDAISVAACQLDGASGITTDQRGVTRPQRGGCDIGAVEVEAAAVHAPPPVAPQPVALRPTFTG
jgi:hypothetical protein